MVQTTWFRNHCLFIPSMIPCHWQLKWTCNKQPKKASKAAQTGRCEQKIHYFWDRISVPPSKCRALSMWNVYIRLWPKKLKWVSLGHRNLNIKGGQVLQEFFQGSNVGDESTWSCRLVFFNGRSSSLSRSSFSFSSSEALASVLSCTENSGKIFAHWGHGQHLFFRKVRVRVGFWTSSATVPSCSSFFRLL